MGYKQYNPTFRQANRLPTFFTSFAPIPIEKCVRVVEHLERFLEGDFVLPKVDPRFPRIPFEQEHATTS